MCATVGLLACLPVFAFECKTSVFLAKVCNVSTSEGYGTVTMTTLAMLVESDNRTLSLLRPVLSMLQFLIQYIFYTHGYLLLHYTRDI